MNMIIVEKQQQQKSKNNKISFFYKHIQFARPFL